jgi:hypothetical protein
MTFSASTAPAGADTCAGPGFSSEPLPADERPVLAFSLGKFWSAQLADNPSALGSWREEPVLTAITVGADWMFDLRREHSKGRVLCIGPDSRRTVDLAEGTMLVLCHTTGRLSVRDIRSN